MEDLVGKVLDNTYRIDKLLGQGGMGAVFQGHDIALDRDVAIKIMHPHISRQQGFRERFLQEARAIANLEYPGIVKVYTFSRDPELLYIAMAFIPGQNLRDWLHLLSEKGMIISLPESLAITELIAEALAYAHRRGVYHRDIKPGNVILRPLDAGETNDAGLSFDPVVTDFGLAKLAEGGIRSVTGMSMGTPAYMAPEQCEGLEVDGRADIYALGIVLYELVTGRLPFEVTTLTEAIRAHTKEPPPPPRTLVADLPSQVEEIIMMALAKPRESRYQTAKEMARALRVARLALPKPEEATLAATQAGRVSLVTMMGEYTPGPVPDSKAWPTPPSDAPLGGRITVLGPDGVTQAIEVGTRQRLTIGREADNDIVLPDQRVSRHHAQITFDGTKTFLTDLNSTNGTFLGTNRLLPGVSEQWAPGQAVRIGDHWLRQQAPQAAAPRVAAPQPAASIQGSYAAAPAMPQEELIHMTLEPSQVAVRPGESVEVTVRILNRQHQVDHFTPIVEHLSSDWVTGPATALRLAPGDSGTVTLRVHPPKASTSRAGDHPFVVRVVSGASPDRAVEAKGTLNVQPFHSVALDLTPTTFTNSGQGRLRIANRGNATETVALSVDDPGGVLGALPASVQRVLQAGQEEVLALPIRPRGKRPLMGTPQTSSFTVKAVTADGEVSGAPGSFTIKPRLPTWAIPLLTTLALIICAAGAFAYSNIQKGKVAKATEQALSAANQTATAVALAQIGADQTAQAMSADEALTATAAVATATAEWLNADPDNDGLTNEQELQWGTDPNNRDTDGDTLSDGEEVDLGISPISKDTDGDGIQDNVDAAPGELPTWTPVPTEVPTPTPYFQPNKLQTFSLTTGYIGSVNKVCLKQDNSGESPGWYVSYVEVDTGSGYKKYTFNRWLAEDKGDGALTDCREQKTPTPVPTRTKTPTKIPTKVPTGIWLIKTPMFKLPTAMMIKPGLILVPFKTPSEQVFKLRIKTGNVADAGTSAKVSIRIYGTTGDTGWKPLN